MTPKQQLISILEKHGLAKDGVINYKKVGEVIGMDYMSVKTILRPGDDNVPRWLKLLIWIEENSI